MSVPATVTRVAAEAEIASATAWATRHGWTLQWNPDALILNATTKHPAAERLVEVIAHLDDYRALPPAWRFVTPGTDESPRSAWPSAGELPGVSGSIFHTEPCVCAPWNRLAYKVHGGPHEDWTMTAWLTVGGGSSKADHLADMLDQLHQHLRVSPGFQA